MALHLTCIYFKWVSDEMLLFVGIYVDDFRIISKIDIIAALNDFGFTDYCKPMSAPAAPGTKLYKTIPFGGVSESSTFPYQSAVGILRWSSHTTHPQILYAVNQCAQHNVSSNNTYDTAAKGIFRYLQGTKAKGLSFDAVMVLLRWRHSVMQTS